ncbi:MAG: hypothetical protein A3J74_06505 [Elusimicrobia bacterium RIFCSPHIGHO2_02_FULL_57_9]|nr:MAG: hypothetical protein A3J74_06505 [Elusimicrobia bacterium RIFCSPHIGHO2_02_FULL_57_9]
MKKTSLFLLTLTMGLSGCFGTFKLTHKLYKWNSEVSGKWINEGVFLGLAALHVYTVSILADAVIFNSIEFWSGNNPIALKETKRIYRGEAQAVLNYAPESRRLRVDSFDKGRLISTLVFEPSAQGMVARDGRGAILMTAKTENDKVVVADASGKIIGRYGRQTLSP